MKQLQINIQLTMFPPANEAMSMYYREVWIPWFNLIFTYIMFYKFEGTLVNFQISHGKSFTFKNYLLNAPQGISLTTIIRICYSSVMRPKNQWDDRRNNLHDIRYISVDTKSQFSEHKIDFWMFYFFLLLELYGWLSPKSKKTFAAIRQFPVSVASSILHFQP